MLIASNYALEVPDIAPGEVFRIGQFPVTQTMLSAFITMLVLVLFALVVRVFFIPRWRRVYDKKSGFRIFIEWIVGMFDRTAGDTVDKHRNFLGGWYFAAAALVCIGTLMELTGLRPPTSDLNLTVSLGLTTFVFVHFFGVRDRGVKRLLHYVNPINIMTDVAVPLSMALRIFGSVFSGYMIMELIYGVIPVAVPALASVIFTLFHALIQSYIYMFLSFSFVAEAAD